MTTPPQDNEQAPEFELSRDDAEAVDHLMEARYESSESAPNRRVQTAAEFLKLLDLSAAERSELEAGRSTLIPRTLLCVSSADPEDQGAEARVALSPAASRAVDGFAGGGESVEALRVLQLLDEPGEPADSDESRRERIDRIMQAVRSRTETRDSRFRLSPPARDEVRSTRRIQISDFIAVAAVLLVGTAILFPSMFSSNTMAEELRCAQNMHQAGLGFELFAQDHDGRLPSRQNQPAQASPAGFPTASVQWWRVGEPGSSHSANLFVLIREDYVPMEALACPGNHRAPVTHAHEHAEISDWQRPEEVSYSYQLFNGRPPRYSDPGVKLLLADRSPVITPAMRGEVVDATRNSHNHKGRGQNLLLPDFSVYFVNTPEMPDGDNMWLPRPLESSPRRVRLTGSEVPAADDAFVGP